MGARMNRRTAHRLALHFAITERDGYADAWEPGSPERERAEHQAAEFRRVLKEEFGEVSIEDALGMTEMQAVNVIDLAAASIEEGK